MPIHRIVSLTLLAAAAAWAEPRPEIFSFDSAEAARAAWTTLGGQLPDTADDPDLGRCLVLAAPFAEGCERGYWDRVVDLDLSDCEVISFLMNVSDHGSVGSFGFYLKSGPGWYARFLWPNAAGWQKYGFPKNAFGTEGEPAGWDQIDGLRLSFWPAEGQPQNVTVKLADFRTATGAEVGNLLKNSSFEISTTGGLPDGWSSGHWGLREEPWVLDLDLWRQMWRRDEAEAFDGQYSLRLQNDPGRPRLQLHAVWITPTSPDKTHTFSAYLKADRDGLPVSLRLGNFRETVRVGTDWQRYAVTGVPGVERLVPVLAPEAEGVLWVDAVQLERSDEASPYAPLASDLGLAEAARQSPPGLPPRDQATFPAPTPRSPLDRTTVKIDEHGRYTLNGQPFIPYALGVESTPTEGFVRDIAAAGFNAICWQMRAGNPLAEIRARWDLCAELGIYMIPWIDAGVSNDLLREWITALKGHPAGLAWYVLDEPGNPFDETVRSRLALAHETDPSLPAYVNYVGRQYVTDLPGDIASLDHYPIPWSTPAAIAAVTQQMVDAVREAKKPAWIWLQGTGFAYWMDREPTPLEEECMVYLALVHGARGLLYFAHKPRSAPLWEEMRLLGREVEALTPILSDLSPAPEVTVNDDRIHFGAKRHDGRLYLMAVNTRPETVEATFASPSLAEGQPATVLFENRTVEIRDGQLTDPFGPYVRHVYEVE